MVGMGYQSRCCVIVCKHTVVICNGVYTGV